jgi:hypothetical protein
VAKILSFRFARASGSWDADMRQQHNRRVLDAAGHRTKPPECHGYVSWAWFDAEKDCSKTHDPDGSKEK